MTTTISHAPITAADRCDRCAAAAFVRVHLDGGKSLQFCGHHFRENEIRLREIALDVQEQTS